MAENRTFLWFSDIHLDPYYGGKRAVLHDKLSFGENCQSPQKLISHPYGDFGCDAPPRLLHSLLESAAATSSNADFAVITGDFVRHGNDLLMPDPMAATREILQNVSGMIRQYLPDTMPVVPALGNNDITPDYYLDIEQPQEMLQMVTMGLSPVWLMAEQPQDNESDNLTTSLSLEVFPMGGYYAHNVTDTITVLSLNTILYSTNRQPPTDLSVLDPLGQFAWMKRQLQLARDTHRKVYLIGHIPPSIGSYRHTQLWKEEYLETYYRMVGAYSDVVTAQLFGHIHTDEFRVHNIFPLFLTSSFTPIYGSNPSYRVVTYDSETSALLDYHVYYLDLKQQATTNTNNVTATWQRGQSFTQAYGVPDMSLTSLKTIVEDLQNSTDTSIYWEALLSRLHVYTHGSEVCDATCRKEWACTLSSMTARQYHSCVGAFAAAPIQVAAVIGIVGVVIVAILLIVLGVQWCRRCLKRRHYRQTHSFATGDEWDIGSDSLHGEEELPPVA